VEEPLTAAKAASVPLATSIGQQMDAWAQAWRRGDSNSLANLYAPGFKGNPAQNPLWKRRPSKNDPIDLEIEEVSAKELVNGTVETRFQQSVITLDGVDVGEVVLTWQQLNGRWRIVRERRV
jgi:ketosteroid isomerase-like protein